MPALLNGSPTHPLIVHAVAVLLPLAVLGALALVFVPATRRAYGALTLLVGFVACLAVPLAFASGGGLEDRVPPSPLIARHVHLAHQLLPVAAVFGVLLALFVFLDIARREGRGELNRVEAAVMARVAGGAHSRRRPSDRTRTGRLQQGAATLLVLASLATAVAVVRTGDSGSKAAWHGRLAPAGQSLRRP
ncbi:MAG: DUF2231 domain-containing protein [Frankia sp.]